ncbi:hypothetical protein, partial [Streptomyces sp. NPDC060027]|uniref:hypothetical protein n=1 Tax=Streptomyces sp. NPDC060027 TaxID=3347040 RepID=UPI003678501A
TEHSGRAVGDEAGNPTARAVGIPLLQEGEEVKSTPSFTRWAQEHDEEMRDGPAFYAEIDEAPP